MVNKLEQRQKAAVFISYAREDKSFALDLVKNLEARGIEAKGDWLLTIGEGYLKRLREFNLGAHAFIFIISPDSIKSEACRNELALAVEHKKQILPVSHRDHHDDNLLDSALRAPQWTFLREGDDVQHAMEELVKAINTDFALMDTHGRLLVAADNWQNNGRNRSYLLRRDGLKNAEGWLAMTSAQPHKLPQPTPLETEFISASQRARSRGTRIGIGITFSIILALTVLSIVAWVQRTNAVANAEEAGRQAEIAKRNESEAERQRKYAEDNAREADKQRKQAEENAEEAKRQQAEAEKQQRRAERQTQIAEERLNRNQHLLYASNVNLAHVAYQETNIPKMSELLEPYLPTSFISDQTLKPSTGDLRGFEWFYLWNLKHGERSLLKETGGEIYQVAFSPDGKLIAAGGRVGVIMLWKSSTLEWVNTIKADSVMVSTMTFSADSQVLISGGYDKTIRLWQTADGKEFGPPLTGHHGTVRALAVSPDGKVLASASEDDKVIRFWDLKGRKEIAQAENPGTSVTSLTYIPHSSFLAGADWDSSIRLWDLSSKKPTGVLQGHLKRVSSVAASPDGKLLASSSDDGTVKLWDVTTQKELHSFVGHQNQVYSVNFSRDGKFLASASEDLTINLWNVEGRSLVGTLKGHTMAVNTAAFSPDGMLLISGGRDSSVRMWNATSKEFTLLKGHDIGPNAVTFSPDGKILASASNDWKVKLWDAMSGREMASLEAGAGAVEAVAFSPDSTMLASAGGRLVVIWDVAKRAPATSFNTDDSIYKLAFSPDGKTLALGDKQGKVELRRTSNWQVFNTFKVDKDYIAALAFSPNGKILACASDGVIELRNTMTWRPIAPLKTGGGTVQALAFTPDSRKLASAGMSQGIKLWDTNTYKEISTPAGHLFSVSSLAFSPDGRTLASAGFDKVIRLWDTFTLRELTVLKGHSQYINSIAFSPDGQILASAGYDKTIFL